MLVRMWPCLVDSAFHYGFEHGRLQFKGGVADLVFVVFGKTVREGDNGESFGLSRRSSV